MVRGLFAVIYFLGLASHLCAFEIKEVTSPGGIKAWLVEEHSIPFTAIQINFKGGSSLDRTGKRGAIHFMSALLEEGAGELDASGFAEELERLAAYFNFNIYDDSLTISAKFLTENRDEAVSLLRMALIEPRFDLDPIERVRNQILSILNSNKKKTQKIASETFYRKAFSEHPYGSQKEGTVETVSSLTQKDIRQAYSDVFSRDRVFVSAVGDIDALEFGKLLDKLLMDIPVGRNPLPNPAVYSEVTGYNLVDFDSPQSIVLFGHRGIKLGDPDFFAAYTLNHILGGDGFGSRLMTELREKNGLTYGVSSYLANWDGAELILGQFSSLNESVLEAIKILRFEWKKISSVGVTME
ncbi:MAG: pitrilysin family protein, partial [Proteobacteria bacterium]|nr:pitrilysin family protein [Pseudomonadota bacterium]